MTNLSQKDFTPLLRPAEAAEQIYGPHFTFWGGVWQRFKAHRLAFIGLLILAIIVIMAIIGPLISPYTYYDTPLALKNLPPSREHWLGTDDLGRDLFTRVWYGARISLFVGISAAGIDMVIGILWGSIAAFVGGRCDELAMRIADILYAIPHLLVVILLMVIMGAGLLPILVAMTLTGWINMARIVRGQILQLKNQEYILAAQALGAGFYRILFKHLIPNAMGPIIVTMTLTIPSAIFVEAFLSFLGLGVQAPVASWGTMASDGLPALQYYPWRLFFPAFFISVTMLAFNLVGDGLQDSLDPRMRK